MPEFDQDQYELRHSDDWTTTLPNNKSVRKEHTFNTIELAPISHTWKLFDSNFSLELTSHKVMSPIPVPTEKSPYKYQVACSYWKNK